MDLQNNLQHVESLIHAACKRSNRSREEIQLIAVTKYATLEQTRNVLNHGLNHLGESRWQNAKEKWNCLGNQAVWHFIGHLQTNKVKDVITKFDYIHSLDRLSLAQSIEQHAAMHNIIVKCFVQVNISEEASKQGLKPEEVASFLHSISSYSHIHVIGLMTMAPYEQMVEQTRPIFRQLRRLRDTLNAQKILPYDIEHLSMGMSNDFEVAIEEGATWIRLGTILLGGRGGE